VGGRKSQGKIKPDPWALLFSLLSIAMSLIALLYHILSTIMDKTSETVSKVNNFSL
jgi:predicted PurR-regulated permease PerM